MENVKILIDGIQKDVYGLFYVYNSKYYFIYTEKELDENNYVILYMTQVGKETQNTANGTIETGYMVGIEITDPEEQKSAQTSVSYIVEDKKNNTVNPQIQYLPMSMLSNLKIVSKKRFRLLKSIMIDNFKINFDENTNTATSNTNVAGQTSEVAPVEPVIPIEPVVPAEPVIPENTGVASLEQLPQPLSQINNNSTNDSNLTQTSVISNTPVDTSNDNQNNVIIDYRTKYFEEEEKNKELQEQIEILTQKLNEIRKVIE